MLGGEVSTAADKDLLRIALEGVDALYAKGKISQNDYFRYRKTLEETGHTP
jgi:hypothetical protein